MKWRSEVKPSAAPLSAEKGLAGSEWRMTSGSLEWSVEERGTSDEDTERKAEAQSGATNELPCLGGAGA